MPTEYSVNPERYIYERVEMIPEAGCWLWNRRASRLGYGLTAKLVPVRLAHRLSYMTFVSQIPKGMHVCHKCDTPLCVNPAHLFIGDTAANMSDRKNKGRYIGDWNGRATITNDVAVSIYNDSGSCREIGIRHGGVSERIVSSIRRGDSWGLVTGARK